MILTASVSLWGYSDADMDGVEDRVDKCPQTSLSELVNLTGCPIANTKQMLYYDVILGGGYSQMNYASQTSADTATASVQTDLYLGKWWLQALTSYYHSSVDGGTEKGWDDSSINLLYQFTPVADLIVHGGAGIVLPTYKSGYHNEAIDYTLLMNIQYPLTPQSYLFGGGSYTWVQDTDTPETTYQNTASFQVGGGYQIHPKGILNLSYNYNESIYKDIVAIKTVGIGYTHQLNSHWFVGADYGYGLSDSASDNAFFLRVGYYNLSTLLKPQHYLFLNN